MPYTRTNWRTEETPLSAGNFNNIEDGVEEALNVTRNLQQNFASLALDIFYPVGSYYETSKSTAEFNPGTAWGGTWELESSGLVHVSAGTGYTIGATGGREDAVIPKHNHGFTNPSITRTKNVAVSIGTGGDHDHYYQLANPTTFEESGSGTSHKAIGNYSQDRVSWGGSHSHTANVSQQPEFTASGGAVGYSGIDDYSKANMQPYIVVNRWHRTA